MVKRNPEAKETNGKTDDEKVKIKKTKPKNKIVKRKNTNPSSRKKPKRYNKVKRSKKGSNKVKIIKDKKKTENNKGRKKTRKNKRGRKKVIKIKSKPKKTEKNKGKRKTKGRRKIVNRQKKTNGDGRQASCGNITCLTALVSVIKVEKEMVKNFMAQEKRVNQKMSLMGEWMLFLKTNTISFYSIQASKKPVQSGDCKAS